MSAARAQERTDVLKKILSASFYALASFLITVVNKTMLTTYAFPSFLVVGLGQMAATIMVLWAGRFLKVVRYPPLSTDILRHVWPLPVIYLGNMITGLGSTKELSLPMFTALRRFSVLMTMLCKKLVLGVTPSCVVQASVYAMVGGAILAAANDATFSLSGYTLILLNDVFTASNGVYIKKKLDSKNLGKYGLMYYNALFMIIPATVIAWITGDLQSSAEYKNWDDSMFHVMFLMSCVMGFVLSYSVMLCTQYNSALTTTIIGCLKNIVVTYLGMVIGGDYVFSVLNFVGLNISVLASIVYTYVTFKRKSSSCYSKTLTPSVNSV
ncbi:hypothetical protein PYW08_004206 [Mythimna loreyi]|uniref:Uncharacterized protein n=1 Tax=Mythimna loreyi TaxID=667449 RepID=A0ACC2QQG5_9NEOP|nr:hypothetical protein PYW08_004206 [Mythimna loreyi]